MDPLDQALIRLADPAARATVLDADALLEVATTCYDIDPAAVVGATTAVYDAVDLAVALPGAVTASGRWSRATEPFPVEATAFIDGLIPPTPAADAIWAGSVVVRTTGGDGTITDADVSLPDLDGAIAMAEAALPANATDQQRTDALRLAARTTLANPSLTDTELDAILFEVLGRRDGAVPDLARVGGPTHVGVRLSFSAPSVVVAATPPLVLPVVVAFIVADGSSSPRKLLQQSEAARRAAARYPVKSPPVGSPYRRRDQCVCWVLPATSFDDDGWPGGTAGTPPQKRQARIDAARGWLRTQGVAVVTT